jgi:hypothetical protein
MLSYDKGGIKVQDFLVSKAISVEGGKSPFSLHHHIYKEMCLLLRRKDHFSRDPFPLPVTTEGSKLLQ